MPEDGVKPPATRWWQRKSAQVASLVVLLQLCILLQQWQPAPLEPDGFAEGRDRRGLQMLGSWGRSDVAPSWLEQEVPSGRAPTPENPIFRLSDLLKHQVSVVGSLEMARLAFRHADPDLAGATEDTFSQARDLFQHAANLVVNYAAVAQQVSETILPDLQLAVEEQEPNLAVSLLSAVQGWVSEMKREGDLMRSRYSQLQESVFTLVRRAQSTKSAADRHLAEAVRTADLKGDLAPENGRFALELKGPSGLGPWQADGSSGKGTSPGGGAVAAHLPRMGSWSRQLFEQLSAHSTTGLEEVDEAWKRSVIDLLFMAPGAIPPAPGDVLPNATHVEDGETVKEPAEADEVAGDAACGVAHDGEATDKSVVRFVQLQKGKARSALEVATNSSVALLRALQELRRVDAILQACTSFWADMDSTVQKLSQMKDVTERLVGFASSSDRLRERFMQRLTEYTAFWESLESLCNQYALDHKQASGKMQDFIREVSDAADLMDTTASMHRGAAQRRQPYCD